MQSAARLSYMALSVSVLARRALTDLWIVEGTNAQFQFGRTPRSYELPTMQAPGSSTHPTRLHQNDTKLIDISDY